jgi:peptidoglycan/xylan/chitin deacetylase (PgdA/CDA1 family)
MPARPCGRGRSSSLSLTDRSVVLCYHAVSPTWVHRLCIESDLLLRQVRALRRFARVHVTFDDAFRSIESVLPQLSDLGVPVTVFVCSGYADRGGAPLLVPELESDDPDDLAGLQTMSWEELRGLEADGVTIGSHTITHAHLTQLGDDELSGELSGSKERIEEELRRPCPLLAYPYGEHDARVRAAAKKAGYERAFGLQEPRGDPFASPRVDLYWRHTVLRTLVRVANFSLSRHPTDLPKQHVRSP